MTYKIIAQTNGYIANKDAQFNGKTEITIETGLELKEAYKVLLNMFNEKYADNAEVGYAANWGLAVIRSRNYVDGATPTFSDGTRSFDWDGRRYAIEAEEIEEY